MGWFLRLIGSEFVDRFNRHSGAMDTRRLMRAAAKGQSLGFFPEGTIPSEVGIAPFHPGAFVIAARTQLPVVPVSIEGARAALPLGTIWLKPGRVTVSVLETVPVATEGSRLASDLRSTARDRIVAAVGEPDLASALSKNRG
jgi:1-acyl-sn-glycerol-3-phosphate acyltransferase